jgi:LAO/AO transport system kinase
MAPEIKQDHRELARSLTKVENESEGYQDLLANLDTTTPTPVIGLTGPPGAGKSTLVNQIIKEHTKQDLRVAVLAVDPSSPFNFGALLGDRVRMSEHYENPNVFIRSIATRGSLGGLSEKIIEMVDVVKGAGFDAIFIETVGVGQAEVEIAGIADTTVVVLVPDAGDEIQTMKAGVMEIADIFVVNKSDRPNADTFARNLEHLVHEKATEEWEVPVLRTVASEGQGVDEVVNAIREHGEKQLNEERRVALLAQKAMKLISKGRTSDLDEETIRAEIREHGASFNLYAFVQTKV